MNAPLSKKLLSMALGFALLIPVLQAHASVPDDPTTITLDKPVYFLSPDGSNLVVQSGTYSVEAAQEWIRLIPGNTRQDALLIEAKKETHDVGSDIPIALSIPGDSVEELNLHHIQLLLPGGTSLEATGTYDGIRSRGWYSKARKRAKAAAARARRAAAKRAAAARAAALRAKQAAEQAARAAAAKAQELARQAAQYAKVQACKVQVSSIRGGLKAGQATEALMKQATAILPVAKQRQGSIQQRLNQDQAYREKIVNTMAKGIDANKYVLPEMNRIQANLSNPANRSKFFNLLFSPKMICENSIMDLDKALIQAGLAPKFATVRTRGGFTDEHIYLGFQVTLDAAYVGGAQVGIFGVTDFQGNGGWFWFLGPEAGIVVGAGGSLEAIFFPKVNMDSFPGWGSGIGGSIGAGATFNADGMWDGSVSEFQGFGIGGGGGVGSKMVGSLAVSYTHSWKIGK